MTAAEAPRRDWEECTWANRPAAYVVALALWAVIGIFWVPILSMILTPLWMVLVVSIVPRWIGRVRRSWGRPA